MNYLKIKILQLKHVFDQFSALNNFHAQLALIYLYIYHNYYLNKCCIHTPKILHSSTVPCNNQTQQDDYFIHCSVSEEVHLLTELIQR